MESLPVGKRTRSQRALFLKEQNRKARLAARNEWKKRKEISFEGDNGGIKVENLRGLEDDDNDDVAAIPIDLDEFLKSNNDCGSVKISQNKEVGIVKKEVFDHHDDDNHDEKGKGVMNDDVNGYESDDSVQIIEVRYNPLGVVDDHHHHADDDDECHHMTIEVSSDSDDERKNSHRRDEVEKGENSEENAAAAYEASTSGNDDDDDDTWVLEQSHDSFDYSSSENSVEEVDESKYLSTDVDDDDDDKVRHDRKREKASHVVVANDDDNNDGDDDDDDDDDDNNDGDDDDDGGDDDDDDVVLMDDNELRGLDVHNDDHHHHKNHDNFNEVKGSKRKENTSNAEIKRRVLSNDPVKKRVLSNEKEEKKQENEENRKRGRPRKENVDLKSEDFEPCSSKKVRKSNDKEIQDTLLNSILEEGNKGFDEILTCTSEFYLPLKFKFGVDKLIVHEKPEDELEVDNLFKELDFAFQASNIGADDDSPMYDNEGDGEDNVPSNNEISQKKLCAKGIHCFIVDDEIGVLCKFCSYVNLEIKQVMPDFNKDPFGRGNRRDYYRNLYEDIGRFQFPDSSYDHQVESSDRSDDIPGTVWDLIPGVRKRLYPHQQEGFEFIWKNTAGGIRIDELGNFTKFGLGGCMICHAPGTGKTRLSTVFLQSFMKLYRKANPVVVAPSSMLRAWEEEFEFWKVPFFNFNENELSGKEDRKILDYSGNSKDSKTVRSIKLSTWASGKGVLGISYTLLGRLAGDIEGSDEKVREILLKKPGIVVLDEGHTPRNDKSNIWKVVSQFSTKRRVILSGTPFQNNFEELHNTISLVREEFGAPILSTFYEQDHKRIQSLRRRIKPFVHVHKGEILKEKLKGLFHSLIILKPSMLQKKCFQLLTGFRLNRFEYDNLVSTTAIHPSILYKRLHFGDKALHDEMRYHRMDLDAGVKTRFLVELIKLSKGERVLVFGQFLPPLKFIADLLKSVFCWTMQNEILYIDGGQNAKEKQSTIKAFNNPSSNAKVLLASTKACSEGIHLVGASRVVLLDVVWNPSVERQAISRAYRLGQEKDVFVYHLITSGTLEEDKFQKQATKEHLSELMFSSSEESLQSKSRRSRISEDRVLEEMLCHDKMKHLFEKIIYQPKSDSLIESF